jgi:hypothetical protein
MKIIDDDCTFLKYCDKAKRGRLTVYWNDRVESTTVDCHHCHYW